MRSNIMETESLIAVSYRIISPTIMQVVLNYIHPSVIALMEKYNKFVIHGVTFIASPSEFTVISAHDRVVGEIRGLAGTHPRNLTTIQTMVPELLQKIEAELTVAFDNLADVVRRTYHSQHLPIRNDGRVGMAVYHELADNSTQSFIRRLNFRKIVSSRLPSRLKLLG